MTSYLEAVNSGVVIFDGASGTNLQTVGLTADDFGGPDLEGCTDLLNLTRPDVIRDLHRSFLEVGVDAVETNTFGAFAIPLREYGLEDRAYEIAASGATLAREVVDSFVGADGRARFVAGSIGPGTKFATLGQVSYRELVDAYETEARGLLDGGVDLLIIETQFDLLGAKAAIEGSRRAMKRVGRETPIQAQVTIELTGRMLPGTEIGAALTALQAVGPDVIGLNCATGPAEMYEPLRHLSRHSPVPISAIPNAGLPHVEDGEMVYDLKPEGLATELKTFVSDLGVGVVGGCCGTTPEHLHAVVEAVRPVDLAVRDPEEVPSVASIYSPVSLDQDTSFLIVGERANANGSRAFREALLSDDIEACIAIGQSQLKEGAHLVDLCVDYVGRAGVDDMRLLAARFATDVAAPVVLDSTEWEVMEAGLEQLGGRSLLNSANLEDGEGEGSRIDRVFRLARRHGAGVICLLIDEDGQARDLEWKLRVAHRIHDLAIDYGLKASDLIFDALTFPLTTGDDDLRRDGIATLNAIKRIKEELAGARTILGVSNCSFGLNPAARRVLNSVFLHEAVGAGLDAAIVDAGKIMPLSDIDEEQRRAATDLVYDRRADGYDPLERILELFQGVEATRAKGEPIDDLPLEERLARRIIDGDQPNIIADLEAAMTVGHRPLEIINEFLLAGMKVVGDRFASGEMQLPFVLKSAETMKKAVAHLEPLMEQAESANKGSVVLATVSGDVHDIGKNLVDIILSNNGYQVHNLGIKVGIAEMVKVFEEKEADAIGMSGLLVKSTLIMKDNLDELERRGLGNTPVLLGGAALTRSYVESDLRSRYQGPLYYGKNAFAGLDAMGRIVSGEAPPAPAKKRERPERGAPNGGVPARSPEVKTDNRIFEPPFVGSRVVRNVPLDEVMPYLNLTALYRNQWQYRPESGETDAEFKNRLAPTLREQLAQARKDGLLNPQVVYGYFPANSDGDELIIWSDSSRNSELTRFGFPRQQEEPYLCISDFHRPLADEVDYVAFHIVTMGSEVSRRTAELFEQNEYTAYLHLHGLGVEMAEAFAEHWHHRIRTEWGFVDEDGPTLTGLFRQKYRGGRYSWGYPACPDLEDNQRVADLLGADRIGIDVGQHTSYQYQPEQTTSAIICHHPQAKYFIARKPREVRRANQA